MSDRTLHLVPIIHAEADLGRLSEQIRHVAIQTLGADAWDRKAEAVEAVWDRIESWAAALGENLSDYLIYQDGLPVTDHAEKIVRELASKGSRNHRIVSDLLDRGANLVGTESPELLLREYEAVKAALESGNTEALTAPPGSTGLLAERDAYIAQRIDETLKPDQTGILFIGMLHDVTQHLPKSITITRALTDETLSSQGGDRA